MDTVGLLGPVTALRDGDELVPNGLRLRGLLARLALDAGRPVGVSVLVDDLWGEQPPESAPNALQSLVSRLRRALGADLVVTASGGYRLALDPDAVDALRFDALRRAAAAEPDPGRACASLRQALALWRGPALADVRDLPFAGPAAARLAEARASGVEELAARAFDAGESATVVDELTTLLADQPLRESAAVALARALAAGGRQADALAVLDRTRDTLAGELGVDPGPELARTRMTVLRGIDAPAPVAPASVPPRPAAALTSFVGRDSDLVRLRALLERSRLVTIIGPGGAGKTRIARETVLGPGAPTTPIAIVELAPLTAAGQIVAALLHAVGGPELVLGGDAAADPETRLRTALAGRSLTLVLDNCEHLVDPIATLVEKLLATGDGLRVLTTSREPLNVPGEVLHPLGALAEADATSLFADRASAVRPGFDAGAHAVAVAEICRRLDGQPLPIELAAARTRTLSSAEIAHRLDDRFRLLTSGPRTALPRHQTLRAVVDWSWDLLSDDERRLAARLGVFAGGVDADTVDAVCGGDRPGGVFDELASLVDKSLVTVVPGSGDGPTRYAMLETIREYAHARLRESGERDALVAAHADWALRLAGTAEPGLRTRDQLVHLATIRRAEGEIVRALDRAVDDGDAGRAHHLLAAMSWSWLVRGALRTAQQRSEQVWALPVPAPGPAVAMNRAFRALMRASEGESGEALEDVTEIAAMLDGLPEPRHPAVVLATPVLQAFTDGDESGLTALRDASPDPWVAAVAAQIQAILAENRGGLEHQRVLLRTAHQRFTAIGDRFGLGMTVFGLGELEDLAGETDAARERFAEAVELSRELGNLDDLPQYLMRQASLAVRSGDPDEARRLTREAQRAVDTSAVREQPWPAAIVDTALADIERRLGDPVTARRLVERAAPALRSGGGPGPGQREAFLMISYAALDLDEGDLDTARTHLDRAAATALGSKDGPVIAMVAELSARWAIAAGRPERAAELLGLTITWRGMLHRGDPECVATHDAVVTALGPDAAAAAIERGTELPTDHPPGPTTRTRAGRV